MWILYSFNWFEKTTFSSLKEFGWETVNQSAQLIQLAFLVIVEVLFVTVFSTDFFCVLLPALPPPFRRNKNP
jgi:hypothetical protein